MRSSQSSQRPARRRRRWLWLIPIVLLVLVLGFVGWAEIIPAPMPPAIAALQSDAQVTVTHDRWWVFAPAAGAARSGLVVYPGARVDSRAYAPAAHALAALGTRVVIVPMPLNLAIFGADRAADVLAAAPDLDRWAIAGHSLGGAMAAQFAYQHLDQIDGLVLWAAYPPASASLAAAQLPVVSIYGEQDGLATPAKIEASRALLPPTTRYVPIAGGNHAQFGWYGAQAGDNPATIGRDEQQAQIIAATAELLREIER